MRLQNDAPNNRRPEPGAIPTLSGEAAYVR